MPEHNPAPTIRIEWNSATPTAGAGVGEVPPIQVPDHTLIRSIGRGSYGEVWLARNILGTYRAVKIVHRSSFHDDRPFEREFAGMQRFEPVSRSHESQLNLLQVGRGPGCFYYVMELADDMSGAYASGGTSYTSPQSNSPVGATSPASPPSSPQPQLGTRGTRPSDAPTGSLNPDTYSPRNLRSELLLRGRLPVDECLRLGLALTTALAHLHRHGLVHRDIKPSNIVFVNGIPKLADIGLVALAETTMSFVGTEGYLPPEGPGTVQADLFSLGKVLYEISTGHDRQQFPELPTDIAELPDRTALAELNELLLRACAPDAKQRYGSAAEMHADLALLQSGGSVRRQQKLTKQLRFVQRAGAVVTAVAAVIAAGWLWQARQTRVVQQLADQKTRLGEENRERIVRMDIANGVRLMDSGDLPGALLWFAQALPLVTNQPPQEEIHRIRIQQVIEQIKQTPPLLQVLAEKEGVRDAALSPDGTKVAIGTAKGRVCMRDLLSGETLWERPGMADAIWQVCFTRDGGRLLVSSSPRQGPIFVEFPAQQLPGFLAVLDVRTGKDVFPAMQGLSETRTNLGCSGISPDDRWLAIGLSNNVIRVMAASDGRIVAHLTGHTGRIHAMAFTADGSLLASASEDRTVRLWHLPSGEPVGAPLVHDTLVRRLAFSPNGERLATATEPPSPVDTGLTQTWDTRTQKPLRPPVKTAKAMMLTFNPNRGDLLLFGDARSEPRSSSLLRAFDADNQAERFAGLKDKGDAEGWDFSPDGRTIAIASSWGAAYVCNLETGEPLFPPLRHQTYVFSTRFSQDGKRLLTASDDGTVKLWALRPGPQPVSLRLEPDVDGYCNQNWGRNAGPLILPLKGALLSLVDPASFKEVHRLTCSQTNAPPYELAVAPSGCAWAAFGGQDRQIGPQSIDLWREDTGGLRHFVLLHPAFVMQVTFSRDSTQLISFCQDRRVRFWKSSDGALERTITMPERFIDVMAFLSDGKRALFYVDNHPAEETVELVELDSQKSVYVLPQPPLTSVADSTVDMDERHLAVIGGQSGVVYDLVSGRLLSTPFKHYGRLISADFSPDGRRLLTSGVNGEVMLWDTATSDLVLQPLEMPTAVRFAFWSADGRFIATRSDDNSARAWDASQAEALTPLLPHSGYIRWAAVARNHRLVTVSGTDAKQANLLQGWDLVPTSLPLEVLTDYAKLTSGRAINPSGVPLPIRAEEVAKLHHSLQARAPQLFE
jgi:WD40 repeat protein